MVLRTCLHYENHAYDHPGSRLIPNLQQGALKDFELEHQKLSVHEHLHFVHPRQLGGRNFVEIRVGSGILIGFGLRVALEWANVALDEPFQGDR